MNPFPGPATMDGYQRINGSCSAYEQVHLYDGNLQSHVVLVDVPTVGLPLTFSLFYNGRSGDQDSPVGHGWRHNYMMQLLLSGSPPDYVTFISDTGRHYGFYLDEETGDWVADTDTNRTDGAHYTFFPGQLSQDGEDWRLFTSGGVELTFRTAGSVANLVGMSDLAGNSVALASSTHLDNVRESGGRELSLAYTGSHLTSVTDPNGGVTSFTYDSSGNLATIVGPMGCVHRLGYEDPNHAHLLTSHTDPRLGSYTYAYNADMTLSGVTAPEPVGSPYSLAYEYGTVQEAVDAQGILDTFPTTVLTDARGKTWKYRFDKAGNLKRVISPLGTCHSFDHDSNQKLLSAAGGFPYRPFTDPGTGQPVDGPYPGPNNTYQHMYTDVSGNVLSEMDPTGQITGYEYGSDSRLLRVQPGRANAAIQGNWVGQYGADGYVLCAFNPDASDLARIPSYITPEGVVPTGSTAQHLGDDNASYTHLLDPRAPLSPTSLRRGVGFWKGADSEPLQVAVQPGEASSFNLSVYTNCADLALEAPDSQSDPYVLRYDSGIRRELVFVVKDLDGTQEFRVPNAAGGIWVTFPVRGDETEAGSIQVTLTPDATSTAAISALAFDPYDNHGVSYAYDTRGNVASVTDGLGHTTTMTYNFDGTLATVQDALGHVTRYFYDDVYQNLTRVEDATGAVTRMSYDRNGNVTTVQDPDGHRSRFAYDAKNRVIAVTDGNGRVTCRDYDANGNLYTVTDANGRVTSFTYTPGSRLASVTDPAGTTVSFTYDATGNVLTATDRLDRVTHFAYDDDGRLSAVTFPDGNRLTYAYDALGRVRAVTSPNGNQPVLSDINLAGAANWIPNPGAEESDPNAPSDPLYWISNPATNPRDTNARPGSSGVQSLKLALEAGASYWSQSQIGVPPGVSGVFRFWAASDGGTSPSDVWAGFLTRDVHGTLSEQDAPSAPFTLPASSTAWAQLPLQAFHAVPGDSQFPRQGLEELRLHGSGASDQSVWFDDLELYMLSLAFSYDAAGRSAETVRPDGARTRLVRDRFGRVVSAVDPQGRATSMKYDSLDRAVQVTDPLGNCVSYQYDAVGNLLSFTDPRGVTTGYTYDEVDRLVTITYPDASTEQFTYDAAGNLASSTNNRGQQKLFFYDRAHRLVRIHYGTDDTEVLFAYDGVGNLLARTERNGDRTLLAYDVLDRLTGVQRLSGSTGAVTWYQSHTYDAEGNRTAFNSGVSGPTYPATGYNTAHYAERQNVWSASGPYDDRNRLPGYTDSQANQTTFGYDVEDRRTGIQYPNGATPPTTTAAYDVVGNLLSLDTAESASLLPLTYGYDLAGNRVSLVTGDDTFDYGLDDAGQLVEETINRFVERRKARFILGDARQVQVDAGGVVSLVPYSDSFAGDALDADRWRIVTSPALWRNGITDPGFVGLQVVQNDGLHVAFPRGYSDVNHPEDIPFRPDTYGLFNRDLWVAAEHRTPVSGDFDIQVDFAEFQGHPDDLEHAVGLWVGQTHYEEEQAVPSNSVLVGRTSDGQGYVCQVYRTGTLQPVATVSLADAAGKFRISRSGSTVSMSYWDGTGWVGFSNSPFTDWSTSALWVALVSRTQSQALGSVVFRNLVGNEPTSGYPSTGSYTSTIYDAGRTVAWGNLSWGATTPGSSTLGFQVAVSATPDPSTWSFVGPDGTSSTWFTTSGTSMASIPDARYIRYQATFAGDGTVSPSLSDVEVSFSGANTSQVLLYSYDPSGNMTRKVTVTDAGTSTEVRDDETWSTTDRINNLNQLRRNDVTPAGGSTTTWRYTYDLSGNMTSKTDGTDTWTYAWDEDNHLILVTLPDQTMVEYTYDVMGRMLTRSHSIDGTTTFEWDGWDCVRETAPGGTVTRWLAPQGELLAFERGGVTYQVHADALTSVRLVTGSDGAALARFDYDAWGNQLPSSFDNVPGGSPYAYVGALGCRRDDVTGLVYMRHRWYDHDLGRFASMDPLGIDGGLNLYAYVLDAPANTIDPTGLGRIKWAVETVKGVLKYVEKKVAERSLKLQKNVTVSGRQHCGKGDKMAKDVWGEVQKHSPHPRNPETRKLPGQPGPPERPHLQPEDRRRGGRGHLNLGSIVFGLYPGDDVNVDIVDLTPIVGDARDIYNIVQPYVSGAYDAYINQPVPEILQPATREFADYYYRYRNY